MIQLKLVVESTSVLFDQVKNDPTQWNLSLNWISLVQKCCCIQICKMTCEACMDVVVYNVEVFSHTVFSDTGNRLAQKMSLYVEFQKYVEVYDGMQWCSL